MQTGSGVIILMVYVSDILRSVLSIEIYMQQHFVINSMEPPKYYLGVVISHSKPKFSLSQQKYGLDLHEQT